MRLSFSRRTDLALAALRALAEAPENRLTRTDLADRIGATPGLLAQVMPFLVGAGWVRSERGPGGGYRLMPEAFGARAEAPENRLTRPDVADRIGAAPGFLAQVMPCRVGEGWVRSERGPGGGYRLMPEAFGARVIDVYELMEGKSAYRRCVLRDGP